MLGNILLNTEVVNALLTESRVVRVFSATDDYTPKVLSLK